VTVWLNMRGRVMKRTLELIFTAIIASVVTLIIVGGIGFILAALFGLGIAYVIYKGTTLFNNQKPNDTTTNP